MRRATAATGHSDAACLAGEPDMTVITGHPGVAGSPPVGAAAARGSSGQLAPGRWRPCDPAVIRIRLLGRFAVEHDGQEIALGAFGGRLAYADIEAGTRDALPAGSSAPQRTLVWCTTSRNNGGGPEAGAQSMLVAALRLPLPYGGGRTEREWRYEAPL